MSASVTSSPESCPICLEDNYAKKLCHLLPCKHTFCVPCCEKLFTNVEVISCPLCRAESRQYRQGHPGDYWVFCVSKTGNIYILYFLYPDHLLK
jgi:hypothetical protein